MTTTENGRPALGWVPDLPDFRDYTRQTEEVAELLEPASPPAARRRGAGRGKAALPEACDLRAWCPPVEDQLRLGSCTAHAGVGAIEYYERKCFGKHIDASRLFLYKVTRNLMRQKGDTGAYLRLTMGAMVLFGVPPEEYWPYSDGQSFDREPPAFCYAFAQNYKTLKYYRHDPPDASRADVLARVQTSLAAGHPVVFGFTVYNSIAQAEGTGLIPYPSAKERIEGGHAVMAAGYDDKKRIVNSYGRVETRGALLIRNSWGPDWGDKGYGWLPYDYVLKGLAEDFWSILKKDWVDTGAFG
jgi:C1A family cysteine protease